MRATVVCCYNDERQYDIFCDSLLKQDEEVKLVGVDNRTGLYRSCSEALNAGMREANTKYIIFSHQDIIFSDRYGLRTFIDYLEKLNEKDILGVAGVLENQVGVFTNVRSENDGDYVGKYRLHGIIECQTIDECFFGGYVSGFSMEPFDEALCNNWHFYAVDRALNALVNGGKVYACDVSIIHASKGNINYAYHWGFFRLCGKYASKIRFIRTTIVSSKTDWISRVWVLIKHDVGTMLKRMKGHGKKVNH